MNPPDSTSTCIVPGTCTGTSSTNIVTHSAVAEEEGNVKCLKEKEKEEEEEQEQEQEQGDHDDDEANSTEADATVKINFDIATGQDSNVNTAENHEVDEETKQLTLGSEPSHSAVNKKLQQSNDSIAPQETKKRIRRVGKTPTKKLSKLNDGSAAIVVESNVQDQMEGGKLDDENIVLGDNADVITTTNLESEPVEDNSCVTSAIDNENKPPKLSKHDEKWNSMFVKLLEFKEKHKHTLVPQCYSEDHRLGRWVHYQRVEYWIFQETGNAKITEERIMRLDAIDFEWDPQRAQWEKMFEKLKVYQAENNHCHVPKSYDKDSELANWVRNQRLEQANLSKPGKKSRMTDERFKLLNDLGFKWSVPTPARAKRNSLKNKLKFDEQAVSVGVPTAVSDTAPDTSLVASTVVVNEKDEAVAAETNAQDTVVNDSDQKPCTDDAVIDGDHHVEV